MQKLYSTKIYGGRVKDRIELQNSSSGGAFTALSNYFLKNGNAIVAAVYNYNNNKNEFQIITDMKSRNAARGSKYMQAYPGSIFKDSLAWLKQNPERKLMFIGTGCQAEGFRKFAELKKIRERVFVIDIICHGTPSPKLWKEYADSLEKKNGDIDYLTFKDKREGWLHPTAFVKINSTEISIRDYVNVFYNQCALRPSCYNCHFSRIERNTDMTVGDFWHIEEKLPDQYDPMGTSLFLVHTDQGLKVFNEIKAYLDFFETDAKHCWQINLERATGKSEFRDEFWRMYRKHGAEYIIKNYGEMTYKIKALHKIKQIVKKVTRGGWNEVSEFPYWLWNCELQEAS